MNPLSDLALDWWWALALLPLPWLARRWLAGAQPAGPAVRVPLLQRDEASSPSLRRRGGRPGAALLWLAWFALLLAAGRPCWLEQPVARDVSGRDLMLAVDISGSMSEADMNLGSRTSSRVVV